MVIICLGSARQHICDHAAGARLWLAVLVIVIAGLLWITKLRTTKQ